MGLQTMIDQNAILDCRNLTMAFTGPGDTEINYSPGAEIFQLVQAPSGHLMLPCCNYNALSATCPDSSLTLLSASASSSAGNNPPEAPEPTENAER